MKTLKNYYAQYMSLFAAPYLGVFAMGIALTLLVEILVLTVTVLQPLLKFVPPYFL